MTILTIAIPTYNNENTIESTILSCINQNNLDEVEILVINNASTDRTLAIISKYKDSVRIVNNKETVSLFENHNVALRNAKTDYILFCHSDDVLFPDATEIIVRKIKERNFPEKYILWGHSLFRDFYPSIKNSGFTSGQVFAGLHATNPFLNGGLTPSGTCYSKSFQCVGGFLTTQHRLAPSDATSMINAALNGFQFEMLEGIIFKRTTASTLERNIDKKEVIKAYQDAFKSYIDLLERSTLLDVLVSTGSMRNLPLKFFEVCLDKEPKFVLKRILVETIKSPVKFLNPKIYSIIISAVIRIVNGK